MTLHRVIALVKPHLLRIVNWKTSWGFYFITVFLLFSSTIGLNWDGETLYFFGTPLDFYGNTREQALLMTLHEFFSWWWLGVLIYALVRLLNPLGDSFLLSQVLWIRLTACSPFEVALSRVIWVLFFSLWVGLLSLIWALIVANFHHLEIYSLFLDVEGLVSYILLSGSLVVAFGFVTLLDQDSSRYISFISLVLPIMLLLIQLASSKNLGSYSKFFPYSSPFTSSLRNNLYHFTSTILISFLLMALYLIIKSRDVVKPFSGNLNLN